MYPDHFADFNNLSVTIDGEDIKDGIFKGKEERIGILAISYLDYVPFQQKVNLQPNETLQILLLPGKEIELYEEEKYITFNGSFILNSGYTVKINGQELIQGLNYISKEKAVGNLEFYKEGEDEPIATISDISIEADSTLNLMQLSDTEFIEVPKDDEPDPLSNKILKARFLYLGGDMLTMDKVQVDFYINDDWCWMFFPERIGTITLEKGEMSEYIELDYSFREPDAYGSCTSEGYGYSFYYDVIDPETNITIVDHNSYSAILGANDMPSIDYMSWTYKKATFILKDGGNACDFQKGLGIPWN